MDQGLGSQPNASPGSIDKSRVLEVKPLRRLVPVFPNSNGSSSVSTPHPTPFTCISPSGPFPPGVQPFYPFIASNGARQNPPAAQNDNLGFGFGTNIQSPIPLNSFKSPISQANGSTGPKKAIAKSNSSKRRSRASERPENGPGSYSDFDFDSLANDFITSFKLDDFESFKKSHTDKEVVETILLVFDLIRRKLTQLEESKNIVLGLIRQPGPKAGALLSSRGLRANSSKRVGHVPGVEVGDIFFFRMELCIVGLHAPSMSGIDYMSVKLSMDEEPVAVSIVSSGGYDDAEGGNNNNNGDVLIYSGQGGVQRKDGQMFDQKLERGNLALEKSLHRGNDVRVIRGIKDISGSMGKIYVYDGLYRIRESWAEKNKLGCSVFKYKLVRMPGQPEAFSLWKMIQQWKDGSTIRAGVNLPDLSSGSESLPVALVNEVDGEKGPTFFTYERELKYGKPFYSSNPSPACGCKGGCQPGNTDCPCNQKNDGLAPYSPLGGLLTEKTIIYECGRTCPCPPNCRNRLSQSGIKARLEVFKTRNRGWGLRSMDPIRAGAFICEYAGDVISSADDESNNISNNNNSINYIFDSTRYYEPQAPFPLVINAKNNGNVARFMNHSCWPNVIWRPVLRENYNETFMHVAFFAVKHIPPMQELTFDYGIVRPEKGGDIGKRKCLCGSFKCRGYFYG
ncbi:Histone-lysine N-methyltransferase- H3 lysine-9 specific SUVH3 [Striga hermonthica]|uniref:Histone-lysine N-methyltransferase- H3 lysine-9 specific SUVH3 n=1 Tax=Striga hermonthica TaxID=68872 RepID=A0A9N7NKR0_STRHE|nr:Histone-lysine N-methyltransferase- H3 lysine-9 specific SUVH3 [Striga hermonthica]